MKIVLNTLLAKKNGGGGFQISLNFILKTWKNNEYGDVEWYYFTSADLDEIVGEYFKDKVGKNYFVFPTQPNANSFCRVQRQIRKLEKRIAPDLIYSILSPSYFFFRTPEVMRCCNAWDLIPRNHIVYSKVPTKYRRKYYFKSILTRRLMKRAKCFITQTSTAQDGISQVMNISGERIKVVPNVLPMVFSSSDTGELHHEGVNIVYVAASCPHKNIDIVPEVTSILRDKYGIRDVHFILTVPYESTEAITHLENDSARLGVSDMIVNKGRLKQEDLADLYRQGDIGFFPSLLETFSATLLEYMKFGLPIVASDFSFNRDVTDSAALYFEPMNAEAAAAQLARLINEPALRSQLVENTQERIKLFDSFDRYYEETVDFLVEVGKGSG